MERCHKTDFMDLTDNVLESEFPFLKDECYLDHAGAALYSRTQIDEIAKDFSSNLYSNPHSSGTSSKHCTDTIDQVRFRILNHFNSNADEYSVIFTSGATAALKMVAETFNFSLKEGHCGTFAYLQESHTSVLGMREIVAHRAGKLLCVKHDEAFDLFGAGKEYEFGDRFGNNSPKENSLFVFPAQCNFSGLKYPLTWINGCHLGMLNEEYTKFSNGKWYCLLDAAALVSTNPLDLSIYKPDFVCLSFYKIFGFPTGLGALLVRNSAIDVLEKSFYGGGTVLIALSSQPFHVKKPLLHERFEDGTLNFLSIVSLLHGLEAMRRLGGDMRSVSAYCYSVAHYCYDKLLRLHHANSKPAIIVYCDSDFSDASLQGNIVNFNILRHNGDYVGYSEVLALANLHKIHLRTGCFCNPGACQRHLGLGDDQLKHHFQKGHVCGDDVDLIDGQPTGSVRVSFGIYSRHRDVDKLIALIEDCFVLKPVIYKMPDSWKSTSQRLMNKFKNKGNCKSDVFDGGCEVGNSSENSFTGPNIFTSRLSSVNIQEGHSASNGGERDDIKLEKVFIYPVKSCAAMEICDIGWPIDSRGFMYDRQWMVVSEKGVALTQKVEPLLCLINPHLSLGSSFITLSACGKPDCSLPISVENDAVNGVKNLGVKLCQSKVCGDKVSVVDCGDDVAAWLSDLLNRSGVRLVRQCIDDFRIKRNILNSRDKVQTKSLLSNGKQSVPPLLSLSNQAQFLLISSATVNWLADQIPSDSDCDKLFEVGDWERAGDMDNQIDTLVYRFRSNFVVSGSSLAAFAEMNWTKIEIGGNLFKVVGPCNRCQMICIDQCTGERTKEPLTTLAASLQGKLKFGVYLEHVIGGDRDRFDSAVRIGDVVRCFEC